MTWLVQTSDEVSSSCENLIAGVAQEGAEPWKLSQPARIPALAALSQIRTSDAEACGKILLALCAVCISACVFTRKGRVLLLHIRA